MDWICAKSGSKLMAQMKEEILILVLKTADGFRASIGALRSLGESEGEFSHFFAPGGSTRAPVFEKNLCKSMPEAEIREELKVLHINLQAVMQLLSKQRVQEKP
jgi:hypothetical protein